MGTASSNSKMSLPDQLSGAPTAVVILTADPV
jgi:hypothetical protein